MREANNRFFLIAATAMSGRGAEQQIPVNN
jgi:hypothetical protein